jgi:hypothetical protein
LGEDHLELLLEPLFGFFDLISGIYKDFFLFLIKFLYPLVKYLDVQFELLLHLDVVSYLSLVLLQLVLVLFGRQIDGLDCRAESCSV